MNTLERVWRGIRGDWRLHLLSVFSVGVAFVCLVASLLFMVNVARVQDRWEHVGRMSVFLRENANEAQVDALEEALRGTAGVDTVRYLSSAAARREMLKDDVDDTFAALPDGAFPASLELVTREGLALQQRQAIAQQLKTLAIVDSVETYAAWGDRLGAVLNGAVSAAGLLALVVLASVVSVVSSTMRLSLQRRRIEVEVLKLVGATDPYVRRPYLVEGAAQGALGALGALLLVASLYLIVRSPVVAHLTLLLGTEPVFLPWPLSLGLLVLGSVLGVVAASLSLRKMLVV